MINALMYLHAIYCHVVGKARYIDEKHFKAPPYSFQRTTKLSSRLDRNEIQIFNYQGKSQNTRTKLQNLRMKSETGKPALLNLITYK